MQPPVVPPVVTIVQPAIRLNQLMQPPVVPSVVTIVQPAIRLNQLMQPPVVPPVVTKTLHLATVVHPATDTVVLVVTTKHVSQVMATILGQ